MRKFDVQPHRFALCHIGSLVCRLHDTGAAAGDHREIVLRQSFAEFDGRLIGRIAGRSSGRSKDSDARAELRQGLKRVHKLCHDAENAPGVFLDEGQFGVVVH